MADSLTTTSYAVLSLLGVRSWSTYELAQQMGRSLAWYWPKAESLVHVECKKLAAHSLASVHREHQGRPARAISTITDEGRAALRGWLDRPTSGPRLEWEAMLQVAFADHGSREQLLENLKAIRADAEARRGVAHAQAATYANGGPVPQRLPVIALAGKFCQEYHQQYARWLYARWAAAWAEDAIAGWDDLRPDGATVPSGAFEAGRRP